MTSESAGREDSVVDWQFRIINKIVTVGEGEIDGADWNVRVGYAEAVPMARTVYMPKMVERTRAVQIQAGDSGRPNPLSCLVELHNRLAAVTL